MRFKIEIPAPTLTIKIKKTSKNTGELQIDMTTPGELLANDKRPFGKRRL